MQATVTNMLKLNELKGRNLKIGTDSSTCTINLKETNITIKNHVVLELVGRGTTSNDYPKQEERLIKISSPVFDIKDADTGQLLYDYNGWKI